MSNKQKTEKMWAELAPYYDVWYQWKDYCLESQYIHELIKKYKKSAGNKLLDVACGTGGHIEHLSNQYESVGLDRNPYMLKEARKKCPKIKFHRGDMINFDLKQQFDVVTCLFIAIAYAKTYTNLKKSISCMAKHLVPGGVIIIEPFFSPESYNNRQINGGTQSGNDCKICRMNVSRKRGNLAIIDFHFLIATKRGVQYLRDQHYLALFDSGRFLKIFENAGFQAKFLKNGLMKGRGLYIAVIKNKK